MRVPTRIAALAALFIALSHFSPVHAQPAPTPTDSARLTITVRDNWGVLPGAAVRLVRSGAQGDFTKTTDGEGRAGFDAVPAGTYEIHVTLPGFAEKVEPDVALLAGVAAERDVVLELLEFATTVTVSTATRREELLLRVAEPTTLLERTQIEDTGARTAKDALVDQTGSGVLVNAGGGQGHVTINGIPNSGVLVLVDGRRYLGRNAAGNYNLEDLELTGVDRIEIVKGASSALYGSDALGGVINVITQKGGPRGVSNSTDLRGGSYGDFRVGNTLGWRAARGGATLFSGYRTYNGFDLDKGNPQTIGQPESQYQTYGLNGDWAFGDRVRASLVSNYNNRRIDNYFFAGATQLASTVYNSKQDVSRYMVSPDVDVTLTPGTTVTVTGTFGTYDRDEHQVYSNRTVFVPWTEWNREVRATARQAWSLFGQQQFLQGGVEFRREELDRLSLRIPGGGTRAQRDSTVGWLQQEFSIGPRLKVTGGFRYDDYSDFGNDWSPKLSAVYAPTERQRLRATYGKGFRAPLFGELYLYTPPFFVGNPNLDPERSNGYTAGYSWTSTVLQATADYFHTVVEDGIVFSDLSQLPISYVNERRYTSRGVNTSASVNLPWGFVPSLSYAYVNREDDQGRAIGGVPEHAGLVKLLWTDPRFGLRMNVRGQVLSKVEYSDGTAQPAYTVWYAQASKRLARGRNAVNVFAQVDNLFNKQDIFLRSAEGQPIPGNFQVWIAPRTFLAGMTVDLALVR